MSSTMQKDSKQTVRRDQTHRKAGTSSQSNLTYHHQLAENPAQCTPSLPQMPLRPSFTWVRFGNNRMLCDPASPATAPPPHQLTASCLSPWYRPLSASQCISPPAHPAMSMDPKHMRSSTTTLLAHIPSNLVQSYRIKGHTGFESRIAAD